MLIYTSDNLSLMSDIIRKIYSDIPERFLRLASQGKDLGGDWVLFTIGFQKAMSREMDVVMKGILVVPLLSVWFKKLRTTESVAINRGEFCAGRAFGKEGVELVEHGSIRK